MIIDDRTCVWPSYCECAICQEIATDRRQEEYDSEDHEEYDKGDDDANG